MILIGLVKLFGIQSNKATKDVSFFEKAWAGLRNTYLQNRKFVTLEVYELRYIAYLEHAHYVYRQTK